MSAAREHLDTQAQQPAAPRTRDRLGRHSDRPAITSAGDPRLAAGAAGAHADLLHVQRAAGNAAVASLVGPSVQRVVTTDEATADATAAAPSGAGSPTGATPAEGSPATEADHTINAAHIGLNAPIVEASGVVRAQTVIADSIVASSYTPGAGNMW